MNRRRAFGPIRRRGLSRWFVKLKPKNCRCQGLAFRGRAVDTNLPDTTGRVPVPPALLESLGIPESRFTDPNLQIVQIPTRALAGGLGHVEETKAAVRVYNELRETEPVGGLFHSTC